MGNSLLQGIIQPQFAIDGCTFHRAEFRVWKEDQDLYYIMFEKVRIALFITAQETRKSTKTM